MSFDLNSENFCDFILYDKLAGVDEEKLAIGHMEVNLEQCLKNPNKWAYDEIRPIQKRDEMKRVQGVDYLGQMYVQIMFIPKGSPDITKPPALKEDLEKALKTKIPISGSMIVSIHHARELVDLNNVSENKFPDPWAEIE